MVFNVTDAGLDDIVAADAIVHCLQPALICAVHEIDDLALVLCEMARYRKRSPDVSFVELIVETEVPSDGFSRLYRPVQEVIVVGLLENGFARYRSGLKFWPHPNSVRTAASIAALSI